MKIEKVLVIDDDAVSNHLTITAIKKLDFASEVLVSTDASQALNYLSSECKGGTYPQLILLDLRMPGMDGFEFLQEFEKKCSSMREEIVVVILTDSRNPEDIIRLRKLGKYYLIPKPLTAEGLTNIYHRYFRNLDFTD